MKYDTYSCYWIVVVLCIMGSCGDAFNIRERGKIGLEETFENVEDLQKGLNGVYASYSKIDEIEFSAQFTDNIKAGKRMIKGKDVYSFNLSAEKHPNIWSHRYQSINYANRILDAYANLQFSDPSEQQEADKIAGQLYALRALFHFDVFLYYTVDYTDGEGLSVPIMDKVPDNINDNAHRNTVNEVYEFLKLDLDKARELLQNNDADLHPAYVSSVVVKALKAKISLLEGDYEKAEALSDEILQEFPLATPEEYEQLFKDEGDQEIIFKRVYPDGQTKAIVDFFYVTSPSRSGNPNYELSNQLLNLLDERDVRYKVLLMDPNASNSSIYVEKNSSDNELLINKYSGSPAGAMVNQQKIIRSSEMLLVKAEAEARQGDLMGAEESIKDLLNRRYTENIPDVGFNNLDEALEEILKQRRIELAFEGHRYLDIKRLGGELGIGISRNSVDCASFRTDQCALASDSYKFTLPVPYTEIRVNNEIEQNPGY